MLRPQTPYMRPFHLNFQPGHYDPVDETTLMRVRYRPTGTGPWPTVISIPPVVFRSEVGEMGTHAQRVAAKDLTDHGFLVFQIEHRLAPPGLAAGQYPHQTDPEHPDPFRAEQSGRPPQQTDDVKQQILAALADPQCDHEHIFLLGGSSGGYHALWAALDSSHENVTEWTEEVRSKIKGVVGLSGIYALQSRDFGDPGRNFDPEMYIAAIQNYTNTTDSFIGLEFQLSVSPQALVAGATYLPPIRLYATVDDTIPPNQSENMFQTGQAHHPTADIIEYTMAGDAHCFHQWFITNSVTHELCSRRSNPVPGGSAMSR